MNEIEAKRKIPVIDVDNYNIVHTLVEDIYKDFETKIETMNQHLIKEVLEPLKNKVCKNCSRVEDCFLLKLNHNYTRVETFYCGDFQ